MSNDMIGKRLEHGGKMKPNKKKRLTIRGILSILVVICIIRQFFLGNFSNMFFAALCLVLFAIPSIIDRALNIDLPPGLEGIIYLFIFAAEILGEINAFYVHFHYWDTMLHTTNGFLAAAVGFSLVDLFNRSERFLVKLSPVFVALTAFCFSMTIGVLWEFFEFGMDWFLSTDMQKDWIVPQINSVMLNPDGLNEPVHVQIESVVINGQPWELGGYLDIGLVDTMKDLFVNLIGAVVFSTIGFFYVKSRGKGEFAKQFIPTVKDLDVNEEEKMGEA